MLSTINIKRTPTKFAVDNLDNEFDALLKQINLGFDSLVTKLNTNINWISGPGIPKNSIGNEGDFYLDETTKNIYKKVKGSWL